MPAIKLTETQRIKAKEIISDVFLFNGKVSTAIDRIYAATGVTLGKGQIYFYRKQIEKGWQEKAQKDIQVIKIRELKKLDTLELEAITQWERSQKEQASTSTKTYPDGSQEVTEKTTESLADPRYVANLLHIAERRAKLLGLDAPTKVEVTDWKTEALKAGYTSQQISELDILREQLRTAITNKLLSESTGGIS